MILIILSTFARRLVLETFNSDALMLILSFTSSLSINTNPYSSEIPNKGLNIHVTSSNKLIVDITSSQKKKDQR
jgi:hypothetical protein